MARTAGSPAARRAWIALRGSYFLAYVLIFTISLMSTPARLDTLIWLRCLTFIGAILMIGSFASYMVVAGAKGSKHWHCLELLEVTGLRALVAIQAIYVLVALVDPHLPLSTALNFALLGAFALGVLANLAWNRGRKSAA